MKRWLPGWLLLSSGCFTAPQIVVVDRATALEEQAGGSFEALELKLVRGGITPRPVPYTPEELEALGVHPDDLTNPTEATEGDDIDRLLKQHCLGESREGFLVDTTDACRGASDPEVSRRLVDRDNQRRTLLWRWMSKQRKALSPEAAQQAWQAAHARGLPCGAWRQLADGSWEAKGC